MSIATPLIGQMFKKAFIVYLFAFLVHGVFGPDTEEVSVMEGDSVTLNNDVKSNQQIRIKWYFYDNRIAQINGDQSKSCTDVQCKGGDERFRDRLKLDHHTGSLTIMNIRNTDSGVYTLKIFGSRESEKIFNVAVHGVAAENKRKTVKEGESVILGTPEVKNPNDVMVWHFDGTLNAEITGDHLDQSQICTDDQCKERFSDRLKLDHQTGSLIITHTRNTDSGEYTLKISNSRFSILRSFSVTVTDSGLSSGVVAGIVVAVLLVCVASAVGVIYYRHRSSRKDEEKPHDRRASQQDESEDDSLLVL